MILFTCSKRIGFRHSSQKLNVSSLFLCTWQKPAEFRRVCFIVLVILNQVFNRRYIFKFLKLATSQGRSKLYRRTSVCRRRRQHNLTISLYMYFFFGICIKLLYFRIIRIRFCYPQIFWTIFNTSWNLTIFMCFCTTNLIPLLWIVVCILWYGIANESWNEMRNIFDNLFSSG